MQTISHGIPQHDYFTIAQPPQTIPNGLDITKGMPILELRDPKSGETIRAQVDEIWSISIDNLEQMDAFCKLTYGMDASKLVRVFEQKYAKVKTHRIIDFILLKKIND